MKQIVENKFFKSFRFSSRQEQATFINNQGIDILSFDDDLGDIFYCYVCYHSLTMEKQFVLDFTSNSEEDELSVLFWGDSIAFDTGKYFYLIDRNLNIRASIEITTTLMGLYLLSSEKLLLLEEVYLSILNRNGEIVKKELFGLLETFHIDGKLLYLTTSNGTSILDLDS